MIIRTLILSAFLSSSVAFAQTSGVVTYTDQGWTNAERNTWYAATQGSRLIPASWFQALERGEDSVLFLTPENVERYRYLIDKTLPTTTYPIGFAEDIQSDQYLVKTKLRWFNGQKKNERWVGMNCSACHTAEFHFQAHRVRVDGAPAISDFQSFIEAMNNALSETLSNPDKFGRFASRVLDGKDTAQNRQLLKTALAQLNEWQDLVHSSNESTMRYGYARLDAFGNIFNRAALFSGEPSPETNPSNAPVSYPFLWNTPQHDRVQWNGSAKNKKLSLVAGEYIDLPALGRNTGQVIGVFGEVVPAQGVLTDSITNGLTSSVFIDNLEKMEKLVAKLDSPAWPEAVLGSIDTSKKVVGEALFNNMCVSCHLPLRRGELDKDVVAQMNYFQPKPGSEDMHVPPETDPVMACNAYQNLIPSGALSGLKYEDENGLDNTIKDPDHAVPVLSGMVTKVLHNQKGEIVRTAGSVSTSVRRELVVHNPGAAPQTNAVGNGLTRLLGRLLSIGSRSSIGQKVENELASVDAYVRPEYKTSETTATSSSRSSAINWGPYADCVNGEWSDIKGYKARPLNGIWATAPYLHNGSVANLYEILLPPSERMKTFYVGSREFDPEKVGYISHETPENSFKFSVLDGDGNTNWGNWNGGHDYENSSLSHEQRLAIVEYLKSL